MKINGGYSIESILSQLKSSQNTSIESENPFETTVKETEEMKIATAETLEQTELIQSLDEMGIEVTPDELEEIESFMNEAEGTKAEKLETVRVAKEMGVDLTGNNLNAINEALHTPLSDVKIPQSILKGKLSVEKMEKLAKFMNISDEVKAEVNKLLEVGNTKEALLLILDTVTQEMQTKVDVFAMQKNDDLTEVELLKAIVNTFEGYGMPLIEVSDDKVVTLELGDIELETEEAEAEPFLESLDDIIEQVLSDIQAQELPIMEFFDTPTIKQYLVMETTERIIEVKDDFSAFQKEIVEALRPLVEGETVTKSDLNNVMSKAIEKLDHVLMKSDIPLYTSMKDEKKLILMSSDLQEAQKLVNKGQYAEAKSIITSVSTSLNEMVFNPHKRHVQGFVKDMTQLELKADDFYYQKSDIEIGARGVNEYLKGLGLNYDSDVAEKLLGPVEEKPQIKDNLKQVLLELKETFEKESDEKIAAAIDKNLDNLNGQQLLNKEPNRNQEQTLHLNIPIVLADEMKDLKLFVQSRDANNRMDWENCTLYFAVDTGKYGKTGIRIKIQNRSTQVQVINNNEEFKEKVGPLIEEMFSNLSDVGFVKGGTEYKSDEDEKQGVSIDDSRKILAAGKGYDFSGEKGLDIKI